MRPPFLRSREDSALLDASCVGLLVLGLLGCMLMGCEGRAVHAELFELTSVGPSEVEAGRRIALEGRGLPQGSTATLTLDGTLYSPGEANPVTLSMPAEVLSSERAEALVTGAFLEGIAHGGRGTFRGRAELSVPMADGSGTVSGALDEVQIDLLPSLSFANEEGLDDEAFLDDTFVEGGDEGRRLALHDGADLSAALGISLAFDEGRATVASVDEASPAARLGLLPGDVIREVDGLRILLPSDLSGWAGVHIGSLEVERGEVTRTLHPPTTADASTSDRSRAVQLAALLVVLLMLLRERERAVPEKLRAAWRRARLDWTRGLLMLAIPVVSLGVLHRVLVYGGIDRLQMLLAPAFAFVVVAGSVIDRSPLAVLSSFGRAIFLLVVIASAVITSGSAELLELEGGQSSMPFTWAWLGTPVAPALSVLLATTLPIVDRSARLSVHLLALAAELWVVVLVVVCLMGGRGDPGWLGALGFAVRGLLALVTLRVLREALAASTVRTRVLAVSGSLAAIAMLGVFVWVARPAAELSMSVARSSGELWLASIVLGALFLLRPRPEPLLEAELSL